MDLPTLTGYERLLPLEQSSVGETWLGRDVSADTLEFVLIEAFSAEVSDRDDLCERIARGADRAASLRHDLVVPVLATGRLEGHLSVIHDFPSGESLARVLAEGQPSMAATLRIVSNIADVLADIHQASTHHGALHPAVVTIGWDGRSRLHKLGTERWIRKVRHDWGELTTRQLSYLSPEHCMNDPLDARTDIFNAGIILWELLTGKLLYEEADDFERMRAICEREAPPPTRFNDQVPPLLNSLTLKALSIDPAERFPDGGEFKSAFEGVLSRASEAPAYKDVVQSFRSIAPERFEGWKQVEEARRQNDLESALRMIGKLYEVDPSPALDGASRSDAADPSAVPPEQEATQVTDPDPSDSHLPDQEATQQYDQHDLERQQQGQGRPADEAASREPTDVTESPYGDTDDEETIVETAPNQQEGEGGEFEFDDEFDEVPTTVDEESSPREEDWAADELEQAVADDETVDISTGALDDQLDQQTGESEQRSAQSLLLEDDAPDEFDGDSSTEEFSSNENVREEAVPTDVLGTDEMTGARGSSDDREADEAFDRPPDEQPEADELDRTPAKETANYGSDDVEPLSEPEPDADRVVPGDQASEPAGPTEDVELPPDRDGASARKEAPDPESSQEPASPADRTVDDDAAESAEAGEPSAGRDRDRTGPAEPEAPDSPEPDEVAADLQSMTIDEWLDDDEDDEEFREPFSLDRVLEDQGKPEQERVRKPALEVIRLGQHQPLDVSVLRGRQRWAIDGESIEVAARGDEATITLRPPVDGWVARASSPGERNALPDAPAEINIQPGDVAQMSDGDVTYRVRFFHPPKSPNHVERENLGRKLSLYGVALAAAVVFHALAALGIITLHTSFGVAMTVGDKKKKEVFAEGKLKKFEKNKKKKKQKKEPPEPPEPKPQPEPTDPSEQEAEVPEQVQDELDERMEEKQKQAEDKSEAEALAAAFEGSGEDSKDSVKEAVSNIDAADSPSDSGSLEVGGKIKPGDGNDIQVTQGDGESELGDIGSNVDSSTGKLTGRDKEGDVRGTVDSVESQSRVEGQLAREKVAKVIQKHQGEIQGCYEQELLSSPGLSGKVTFDWTVTRQGNVSGVSQKSSTLGSAAVANCIMDILRGLKFPKPKGGSVTISYPFMFRSGG